MLRIIVVYFRLISPHVDYVSVMSGRAGLRVAARPLGHVPSGSGPPAANSGRGRRHTFGGSRTERASERE